ncbi:MAG TPA: hypothetical protein DCY13_07910, partial [Verrucomicrobiales bacterium]|nr:hypothetical protein [Verrucomicrobiales bacterium]
FPGNPSSPHRIGTRADAALEQARAKLAGWLGCSPLEIVWTSGATESANLALHHFSRTLPESSEVWTSETEHPCVLTTVKRLFRSRVRIVPVRKDGTIDRQWLEERLRRVRPGLLAIMAANNETGVLQ